MTLVHTNNLGQRIYAAAARDSEYCDWMCKVAARLEVATEGYCLDNSKMAHDELLQAWAQARRVYSMVTGRSLCID